MLCRDQVLSRTTKITLEAALRLHLPQLLHRPRPFHTRFIPSNLLRPILHLTLNLDQRHTHELQPQLQLIFIILHTCHRAYRQLWKEECTNLLASTLDLINRRAESQ